MPTIVRAPMARGMNCIPVLPQQTSRVGRISVANLLKREINPIRSPRIVPNTVGLQSPTAGITNRASDSVRISGHRVFRRTIRDQMHLTCGISRTPVIRQSRSPALKGSAIQSPRRIAVRLFSRSADRAPVTQATTWIAARIGPIPDLHSIRISGCRVLRNAAARLRRWGKTTGVRARWVRVHRNKADRKCGISTARADFRWLRSSVKCTVHPE